MEQMQELINLAKSIRYFEDRIKKLETFRLEAEPQTDFVRQIKSILEQLANQNQEILNLASKQSELISTIDLTKENTNDITNRIIPQVRENMKSIEQSLTNSQEAINSVAEQAKQTSLVTEKLNIEVIPNLNISLDNIKDAVNAFIPDFTTVAKSLPDELKKLENVIISSGKSYNSLVASFTELHTSVSSELVFIGRCFEQINTWMGSVTAINLFQRFIQVIGITTGFPTPGEHYGHGIMRSIDRLFKKLQSSTNTIKENFNFLKIDNSEYNSQLVSVFNNLTKMFTDIKNKLEKVK